MARVHKTVRYTSIANSDDWFTQDGWTVIGRFSDLSDRVYKQGVVVQLEAQSGAFLLLVKR